MIEKEQKEIQETKEYQRRLLSRFFIFMGILVLFIGLVVGIVKRSSLTLLRIKTIRSASFKASTDKYDSILITKSMIKNALTQAPIKKNRFAEGYLPDHMIGDYYPLFTTNYTIKKPLFLNNFFSKGDIGFINTRDKLDSARIEIYRCSFDYFTTGSPIIKISLSYLDSIDLYNIVYYPDNYININNLDTIKLHSVQEINRAISNLTEKYK